MLRFGRRIFAGLLGSTPLWAARPAASLGRVAYGGRYEMRIPYGVDRVDPHDPTDLAAGLFGHALFDTLYARDEAGRPFPALADGMPRVQGGTTIVSLRPGLVTARGRTLTGRDVEHSLQRAKAAGAAGLLASVGAARVRPDDALAIAFPTDKSSALLTALSNPLTAILPRGFSAAAPDGTGAFRAETSSSLMALARNDRASRGASFLTALRITRATDLRDGLRAFEARQSDLGWLGLGLHAARPGAESFALGSFASVVVRPGARASSLLAPGAAQRWLDRIDGQRLAHLGLGDLPRGGGTAYDGEPGEILVDAREAHLGEVADALASIVGASGHELETKRVSSAELRRRKLDRDFALMVEGVVSFGSTVERGLALASAEDPATGKRFGKAVATLPAGGMRSAAQALGVGVLGELQARGGVVASLRLLRGTAGPWDLGASLSR